MAEGDEGEPSPDHLPFDEGAREPPDELKLQFEAVSRLEPEEKRVIQEVVDAILLKHDAKRWIKAGEKTAKT